MQRSLGQKHQPISPTQAHHGNFKLLTFSASHNLCKPDKASNELASGIGCWDPQDFLHLDFHPSVWAELTKPRARVGRVLGLILSTGRS